RALPPPRSRRARSTARSPPARRPARDPPRRWTERRGSTFPPLDLRVHVAEHRAIVDHAAGLEVGARNGIGLGHLNQSPQAEHLLQLAFDLGAEALALAALARGGTGFPPPA